MTCRACDVARDRSIGRESLGRRNVVLSVRRFGENSSSAAPASSRPRRGEGKTVLPEIFEGKTVLIFFFNFREGRNREIGTQTAPFSYTCPNYQFFLGKSSGFLTILKNRVRSRTRVQTFVCLILPSLIYDTNSALRTNAYSEKCHTSKLILRIS